MLKYFVHDSSHVDNGSSVGNGTKIWHFSHVMSGASIGENCILGQNIYIGMRAVIGHRCKIQNNVSLYDYVVLQDDVFCGPSCVFTNVTNPRAFIERKSDYKQTLVMHGASIGANATIVCGVTLGRFCFVGAGAVVTRNVPDYALVYGSPARVKGWLCECGESLDNSRICPVCQKVYESNGELIIEKV